MNFIERATLGVLTKPVSQPRSEIKRVGNQVSLVESARDNIPIIQPYSITFALEREMKRNPFLYSAMRRKADSVASVPFYVERLDGDQWVRVPNHPAEHLIEGANPFMSGYELKKLIAYHKELTGSAYLQIVKVDGSPVFLQPLFPQHVRVLPSEIDFIGGFEYTINGNVTRVLRPNEVFWTKYSDPADPMKGLSPLHSISGEMQTDLEAIRWNKISLSNRGSSDVAFIMRSVVTEDDYQLARTMIEDRIAGPDNARRPWILGGDSDVRPLSYTAVEMDYINTRKFNREVISAALGVPAPLIGASDNSTYNNLDTLHKSFWQDTVTTWLEEFRQDLTRQILIPYFGDGRRKTTPGLRFMYDLSNVEALQVNLAERAEIAKTLRETGFSLRDISQLLELGIMVEDGQSETFVERAPAPEGVVAEMAEVAVAASANPGVFRKAILAIHERLSASQGVSPDWDSAEVRASGYLSLVASGRPHSDLVRVITRGEVMACRR